MKQLASLWVVVLIVLSIAGSTFGEQTSMEAGVGVSPALEDVAGPRWMAWVIAVALVAAVLLMMHRARRLEGGPP